MSFFKKNYEILMILFLVALQPFFSVTCASLKDKKQTPLDVHKNVTNISHILSHINLNKQQFPLEIVILILSFFFDSLVEFNDSIFNYVQYLHWNIKSYDDQNDAEEKKCEGERCYSRQNYQDIVRAIEAGKIVNRVINDNRYDKLIIPSHVNEDELDSHYIFLGKINRQEELYKKASLVAKFDNILDFLRERSATEWHRERYVTDNIFLSELEDKNNIIAVLPLFRYRLVVVIKKTEILFAFYGSEINYEKNFITDKYSIKIDLSKYEKGFSSYVLSYDMQGIKMSLYDQKKLVAQIHGMIPNLIPYKKNFKSGWYDRSEMRIMALRIWHEYVTNALKTEIQNSYYVPKNKMVVSLKKVEKLFEKDLNIDVQPFIIEFKKNTNIDIHTKVNGTMIDKIIMMRNILRAMMCAMLFGCSSEFFLCRIFPSRLGASSFHSFFKASLHKSFYIFISTSLAEIISIYQFNYSVFELFYDNRFEIVKMVFGLHG